MIILGFLLGIGVSILIFQQVLIWLHNQEYPYRWKCPDPDCDFKVKGNNMVIVDDMSTSHTEAFHS